MQVSDSFWDVCRQYFAGSILLPLCAIALMWLIKKWNNKEKRNMLLTVLCVSILVLYNEAAYRLTGAAGESSTYYRFFWIVPLALSGSFLVVELLFFVKGKSRMLLAGVLALMFAVFSSKEASTWVNFPENVYQLDTDVIQVADTLMELSEGEPVTLLDNGKISSTIRQYNARIHFTEVNTHYINHILYTDRTNYLGRYVQDYVYLNQSDYISIEKAAVTRWKVIETGGLKRVAETDNYYLYHTNHELSETDTLTLDELETGLCDFANVEYIPIAGLKEPLEFVYISDFGETGNADVYKEVIGQTESLSADAVFINSRLSENADWSETYQALLEELEVPYYCNNQKIQIIDFPEFAVCMMDNCDGIQAETLTEFEALKEQGKPLIVILSSKLSNEVCDEFFLSVTEEGSPVVQVLSAEKGRYVKELLNDRILQYATPADYETIFNIVRVTALEG